MLNCSVVWPKYRLDLLVPKYTWKEPNTVYLSSPVPLVALYMFTKSNVTAKNLAVSYERGNENEILTTANGTDQLSSVIQIYRHLIVTMAGLTLMRNNYVLRVTMVK